MGTRGIAVAGLTGMVAMALVSCTGGGGATPSGTATTSSAPSARVYSESELRNLVSGLKDSDGNELKLYSQDQVSQGKDLGKLLLSAATVDPSDCKSIATAGLVNSVENGSVAVAISDSQQPRTVSAQSGSQGPDAEQLLKDIRGKMDKCSTFTVEAVGRKVTVTSKQLQAKTDADETFGTLSTRGGNSSDMLMQVSGGQDRLLVVATKSGGNLGDTDQKELEDLVNQVLHKAMSTSSATPASSGPTSTSTVTTTATPTGSATSSPSTFGSSTSSQGRGATPSSTSSR